MPIISTLYLFSGQRNEWLSHILRYASLTRTAAQLPSYERPLALIYNHTKCTTVGFKRREHNLKLVPIVVTAV